MKSFDPTDTAFGRHETFPLRFGWLNKGYEAWCTSGHHPSLDEATVALGVGKNMVASIRYWMLASEFAEMHGSDMRSTTLGDSILSAPGWDRYMEDDATLWLLHWLIASNAREATTLFWFFNHFHKPIFTAAELHQALLEFCAKSVNAKFSATTLRKDVSLLLRMYERSDVTRSAPFEETLDSPMALLGLIKRSDSSHEHLASREFRTRLPLGAFGYAIAEVFQHMKLPALPVERFCRSDGAVAAPGGVFRLTDECTIAKLEELCGRMPDYFELRETAGIHQLYNLKKLAPLEVLSRHYEQRTKKGGHP